MATSQMEIIDGNQEGTELMATSQMEVIDDNQGGTELMATSQIEVIEDNQEGTELMATSQMEVIDENQEGTELIATSQMEVIDENQEGTESMATSQMEVIDALQGGPKSVSVSLDEAEEFEEVCLTNGLAKVTSMTSDVFVSNSPGTTSEIPVELLGKDGNPSQVPVSRGSGGTTAEIPVELLGMDGNPTQVCVSGGRKMKWKDMARGKPHSLASPAPDDTQAIQPTMNRKSEPRRRLPEFIPTHSAANMAIDAIQQLSFPHSSPNVHNNLQSQIPTSLGHDSSPSISVPAISAHREQLPHAQVSSIRFDELLQATNSVSWHPVTDCGTPFDPLGAVHCVFPPSASASVQAPPTQTAVEFSIGASTVDNVGGPCSLLGSELSPISFGKPPRPASSTHSRDFKRSHPSDFTNPLTMQENRQQAPGYRMQHPHEANQGSTNHVHPHALNLPHACRQPLPSANQQLNGHSSLSVPELDPPDDTELPTTLSKRKKSNPRERPQQKRRNKRRLEQLRTQVIKKLMLWGRKSKLFQEADGTGQYSNDQKRLMMGEKQRDVLVKSMVESCRKDSQMREAFLASVKQLASIGVLHSSARLLMDQDTSGRSQDVVNAWKEMHLESAENSSAAVNLYKAVDELHSQGDAAMRNLPPVDDSSLCSFSKTSEGPWELVFPDLGPRNRITKRNEDGLDETLRPSKSRT